MSISCGCGNSLPLFCNHLVALFRERSSLYVSIPVPDNKPVSTAAAAVILQNLLVVMILQYLLVVMILQYLLVVVMILQYLLVVMILQYLLVVVILQYLLVVILAGRDFTNTANTYGSPHVPTPGTYGENFTFRYAHLLVVEILQYNTANSYGSVQVEIHLRRRHLRQGTGTFTI